MTSYLAGLTRNRGGTEEPFLPLEPILEPASESGRGYSPHQLTIHRPDDLDVPLIATAGGGAVVALLAVLTLRLAGDSALATLFLQRGWTQYAALGLASACTAFLTAKAMRLAIGFRNLRATPRITKPLPTGEPSQLERIRDKWISRADVISIRRARALQAYLVTGRRSAATQIVDEDAAGALAASEASYSIPRVMVWAIPLMGFIGTVIGISAAVAGFSGFLQQAEEIEQIKTAIGGVTTGLAVAFDTTLVALALSVGVMLPLVLFERLETRLLSAIDSLVSDTIVARLPEGAQAVTEVAVAREEVILLVDEAIAQRMPNPDDMVRAAEEHLRTAATEIAAQATIAAQAIKQSADALRAEEAEVIQIVTDHFGRLQIQFTEQTRESLDTVRAGTDRLSTSLEGLSATIGARLDALNAHSSKVNEVLELERSLKRSVESLKMSAQLESTMHGVNQSLTNLRPAIEKLSKPRQVVLVERLASAEEGNGQP
jgi:hypothetical protein